MFKQSVHAITIVFKYAKVATILKFAQLFLTALLTPMSIYFTQMLIDEAVKYMVGDTTIEKLIMYSALLLTSMFFVSTGGFFDNMLLIHLKRKLNNGLTPIIVEKFKKLEYSCFEDKEMQDTLKRMTNDPQENILSVFLNITLTATVFLTLIGTSVIFAQISIGFMIIFLVLLFPMIWINYKSANTMNVMFGKQATEERLMNYYEKLLSEKNSLLELRIFGSVSYILNKWYGLSKNVLDVRLKTTIKAQKLFLVSTILFKTWSFFIMITLVYSVISHNITIGLFTALIASIGTVLKNTETLSFSLDSVMRKILLIEHFERFLSLPEITDNDKDEEIISPSIVFDNVTFTYPKTERKILNGVSFEIKPGEHAALVGENGAGKSTIIKLLCGLYKPDSGRILINGFNMEELSRNQLKGVYSVVFQDFGSYHLTLRENIAFGEISKLNDDVALKKALREGLADDISTNLDMKLGKLTEEGVDLSGGQWQRIAIARACVSDSNFIVLDEPTASLDPVAESELYEVFLKVMKYKGAIIISHRLASARLSDKIIVISEGKVSQIGTHDKLNSVSGLYHDMWVAQSEWYKENK